MILFKVTYNGRDYDVPTYHRWDVGDEDVVSWSDCTKEDAGKYIMFDDGTELYTKVITCNYAVIRTEAGSFRRDDIVHLCIPKYKHSNYSGVISKDEHPLVRPYTRGEKALATRMANGEELKFISNRVKMLCKDNIKAHLNEMTGGSQEATEIHVAKTIYRVSNGNGMPALKAAELICNMNDINISEPPKQLDTKQSALFTGMSEGKPRKPSKGEIDKILKVVRQSDNTKATLAEIVEEEVE